jgi:hypothetical protein
MESWNTGTMELWNIGTLQGSRRFSQIEAQIFADGYVIASNVAIKD